MEISQSLHEFASRGEIKAACELLNDHPSLVFSRDDEGDTPLHCAAFAGHIELAELLIAKGADVNARDHDGYTPLHAAVQNDHKEMVALLVAKNANADVKDKRGETPMDLASPDGRKELATLLPSGSKLPLIFILCAVAVTIFTVGKSLREPERFTFIYFHWGIVNDYGRSTFERSFLEPLFGYELARQLSFLDITNPTPFAFTIGFLVMAWIAQSITRHGTAGRK